MFFYCFKYNSSFKKEKREKRNAIFPTPLRLQQLFLRLTIGYVESICNKTNPMIGLKKNVV
jgi:hypothetical protein